MNTKNFDDKINQVLSEWEIPSRQSKNSIWQLVQQKMSAQKEPVHFDFYWRWAVAASAIAIIVSVALLYTSQVNIKSFNGQQLAISLPDGSSVVLNSDSKISYNSVFWYFNRSVELVGEGFFKVKKGSKFIIHTNHGTVRVLGTSFNVVAKPHQFVIECFTGKVAINNGRHEVFIKKGELVKQSDKLSMIKETRNQKAVPFWITGDYSYASEKLATVLNDISAHFKINIKTTNKIKKLSFTGIWNTSMTLEEVLKIVCLPFNLKATSLGKGKYKIAKN